MDDRDVHMLLDEIPHLRYHYLQQRDLYVIANSYNDLYACESSVLPKPVYYGMYDDNDLSSCKINSNKHASVSSPLSGLSLQSGSSSSSLFSGGHTISENGSLTPPPLDDLKSHMPSSTSRYPNGLLPDSKVTNLGMRVNEESWVDELGLCRNLSKMYIGKEKDDSFSVSGLGVIDQHKSGVRSSDVEKFVNYGVTRGHSSLSWGPPRPQNEGLALLGFHRDGGARMDSLPESQLFHNQIAPLQPLLNSPWQKKMVQINQYYNAGCPYLLDNQLPPLRGVPATDVQLCKWQDRATQYEERGVKLDLEAHQHINQGRHGFMGESSMGHGLHPVNGMFRESSNDRIPQGTFITAVKEGSITIEDKGLNYRIPPGFRFSKDQIGGSLQGVSESKCLDKRLQVDNQSQFVRMCENAGSNRIYGPSTSPVKYNSLEQIRGYIYLIAKDQHGCRFLQKIFDEGIKEDVQIIFDEIIKHVVELMINPFANYLMQKLLDVCNEQQILQILLMVTKNPGELVNISLNTHG